MRYNRKQSIDLTAPKENGEIEYTRLQMSRLFRFIMRRLQAIIVFGSIAFVLVVLGVIVFVIVSSRSDNKTNRLIETDRVTRTENRITSCETIRELQVSLNGSIQGTQDLVTVAYTAAGRDASPVQKAQIAQFVKERVAALEAKKVPDIRDCTAAGIAAYYHEKTPAAGDAG